MGRLFSVFVAALFAASCTLVPVEDGTVAVSIRFAPEQPNDWTAIELTVSNLSGESVLFRACGTGKETVYDDGRTMLGAIHCYLYPPGLRIPPGASHTEQLRFNISGQGEVRLTANLTDLQDRPLPEEVRTSNWIEKTW